MVKNRWIHEQTGAMVRQWDTAITRFYPQFAKMWHDPLEHFRCLEEKWNTLEAARKVLWDNWLPKNSTIVDLGCGTGWLSAFLSKRNDVTKIYSVDSSEYFLETMLPEVTRLLGGNVEKIETVQALFAPLLLQDAVVDVVVSSSALHHAADLQEVLNEIHRVLKPGGVLIILNETPLSSACYLSRIIRMFAQMLKGSLLQRYASAQRCIYDNGFLYDPYLGDKMYPLWYWKKALNCSHFRLEKIMKTGLEPDREHVSKMNLTHFIAIKEKTE